MLNNIHEALRSASALIWDCVLGITKCCFLQRSCTQFPCIENILFVLSKFGTDSRYLSTNGFSLQSALSALFKKNLIGSFTMQMYRDAIVIPQRLSPLSGNNCYPFAALNVLVEKLQSKHWVSQLLFSS